MATERGVPAGSLTATCGAPDASTQGMPIAIILTIMPAALLGTVMVMMAPADDRTTSMAIAFAVILIGILFIAIMVLMRDQHPSQAGGDSHLPQDRSPTPEEAEDDLDEDDLDEDDDRDLAITRWRDDGAPPLGR